MEDLGKRFNTTDLPKELINELNLSQNDKEEEMILSVIKNQFNGIASLNEILVGIYKEYNEIKKRRDITLKMGKLTRKGLLISVEEKKGVYKFPEKKKDADDD